MKRNTKAFLVVGGATFMFIVAIAAIVFALFYFHIFNIANVVTGG